MSEFAEFLELARHELRKKVKDLKRVDSSAGSENALSIDENAWAFEAAVLMYRERAPLIAVRDSLGGLLGFIDESSLGEVMNLVKAAPFLGDTVLSRILPAPILSS